MKGGWWFGLLILSTATSVIAADTVYRWVDASGVVHFGTKPPDDGTQVAEVRLKGSTQGKADIAALGDSAPAADAPVEDEVLDRMKAHDRALCERARESLHVLTNESVVVRRDTRSGERRVLSAEEVAVAIDGAKAEVARLCEPEEAE